MKKELGKIFTILISVLFGVFALLTWVPVADLAISFLTLALGAVAIIWTYKAMSTLSHGTSLREYTFYFLTSLIFIVLFSIWDTIILIFSPQGSLVYPKQFLITLTYAVFLLASYKILYVGREFGFKEQVSEMNLPKRKRRKIN